MYHSTMISFAEGNYQGSAVRTWADRIDVRPRDGHDLELLFLGSVCSRFLTSDTLFDNIFMIFNSLSLPTNDDTHIRILV